MSLQVFSLKGLVHIAHLLNVLALLFTVAGGWLLQATRWREQQAAGRLAADNELALNDSSSVLDEATQRMNRAFYSVGLLGLALALGLSWLSVHL